MAGVYGVYDPRQNDLTPILQKTTTTSDQFKKKKRDINAPLKPPYLAGLGAHPS